MAYKTSEQLRNWRLNNPDKVRLYRSSRKAARTKKKFEQKFASWYASFKLKLGCAICGYKKSAAALDWHHVTRRNGKYGKPFRWLIRLRQTSKVVKCLLVCSNCHREIHAGCYSRKSLINLRFKWAPIYSSAIDREGE